MVGLRKPTNRFAGLCPEAEIDERPKTHQNDGLLDATLQFFE